MLLGLRDRGSFETKILGETWDFTNNIVIPSSAAAVFRNGFEGSQFDDAAAVDREFQDKHEQVLSEQKLREERMAQLFRKSLAEQERIFRDNLSGTRNPFDIDGASVATGYATADSAQAFYMGTPGPSVPPSRSPSAPPISPAPKMSRPALSMIAKSLSKPSGSAMPSGLNPVPPLPPPPKIAPDVDRGRSSSQSRNAERDRSRSQDSQRHRLRRMSEPPLVSRMRVKDGSVLSPVPEKKRRAAPPRGRTRAVDQLTLDAYNLMSRSQSQARRRTISPVPKAKVAALT